MDDSRRPRWQGTRGIDSRKRAGTGPEALPIRVSRHSRGGTEKAVSRPGAGNVF